MEALDSTAMQPSKSKAYYALFAIVAIALALFILRWEMNAANAKPEAPKLSYQEAGFKSQTEMDAAAELLKGRKFKGLAPDQEPMVHRWIAGTGKARLSGIGVVARLQDDQQRNRFLPDIRTLYTTDAPKSVVDGIFATWCHNGGEDYVKGLEKDKDPMVAKMAKAAWERYKYPPLNVSGR